MEVSLATLHLAVFVSGRGSNLEAIFKAIESGGLDAEVGIVASSSSEAGALGVATAKGVPTTVFSSKMIPPDQSLADFMLNRLADHGIDFIALAGYLKKIPDEVIAAFHNRILNIHPALLPSFGGPGMYGHHVHEAVLARGCKVSGATVHLVNEVYDQGPIVAQRCVPVENGDTPDTLAARVIAVEHQIFPEALQWFAEGKVKIEDGRVRIVH
jgi:phosphoribosylglycinamide formyltransferase-1